MMMNRPLVYPIELVALLLVKAPIVSLVRNLGIVGDLGFRELIDYLFYRLAFHLLEITTVPIQYLRQAGLLGRDRIFGRVVQEVNALIFQLGIEPLAFEGLVAQTGARFGRAHQGEVNPWLRKFLADNAVLNIIQVVGFAAYLNKLDIPGRVHKGDLDLRANIFYALYGVIVQNQLDGKRIVGVDPVGQLIVFAPAAGRGILTQHVGIGFQVSLVFHKSFIVDHARGVHVRFQQLIECGMAGRGRNRASWCVDGGSVRQITTRQTNEQAKADAE